eukprot:3293315-Rhodomonas_salina.1
MIATGMLLPYCPTLSHVVPYRSAVQRTPYLVAADPTALRPSYRLVLSVASQYARCRTEVAYATTLCGTELRYVLRHVLHYMLRHVLRYLIRHGPTRRVATVGSFARFLLRASGAYQPTVCAYEMPGTDVSSATAM